MNLVHKLRQADLRGLVLPLALLAVWYFLTALQLVNTKLIVPPGAVLATAWKVVSGGELLAGLQASLLRDLAGFAAGSTAGILLGLLLGVSRWAERLVGPTFHTLKQISLFAWLPLLSTWLGTGEAAKILFIALSAFYPVALGTFEGVRSVGHAQFEVARVLGFTRWQRSWRLVLPAAAPQIATGLHLALLYAWLATIGAEYLLGSAAHGIGSVVIRGKAGFHVELIVVGMLLIGVVGMALNRAAAAIEARVLHWRGPAHVSRH